MENPEAQTCSVTDGAFLREGVDSDSPWCEETTTSVWRNMLWGWYFCCQPLSCDSSSSWPWVLFRGCSAVMEVITEGSTAPSDGVQPFGFDCNSSWQESLDSLDSLDGRPDEFFVEPWNTPGKTTLTGCLSIGRQAQIIPVLASIRVHTDRGMKLPNKKLVSNKAS